MQTFQSALPGFTGSEHVTQIMKNNELQTSKVYK